MSSETIEITLSSLDPYQGGARFFAAIAYPDPQDQKAQDLFFQAIIRWTLEQRIALHHEWAQSLQALRPVYFSGPDQQHDAILKRGRKRLAERMAVAQYIVLPHLRAIDTGRKAKVDGFEPTVNNMAVLAGSSLGLDSGSQATVKQRFWRPTKPVAHAVCAYIVWDTVLWKMWERNPNADRQLAFLLLPEMVEEVVEVSEIFRGQLQEITQFKIQEHEIIRFSMKWLDR
jgi:hypothetical protein